MILRDYQQRTVEAALNDIHYQRRRCYVIPTGAGKSLVEATIHDRLGRKGVILTPRVEIARGIARWLSHDGDPEDVGIYTVQRAINCYNAGTLAPPPYAIVDEAHHSEASTWSQFLGACSAAVGLTATAFRGTPAGTLKFRETWGEPMIMLTYREAFARGVISIPDCRVVPLLDDDVISVVGGEFIVHAVTDATTSRLAELCDLIEANRDGATMVSLPSSELCREVSERIGPSHVVTADSTANERQQAFADCVAGTHVLLQINVVSEGVDLPIRRLIDASPTMSPVRWLQQIGRIMRPGGMSQYIATNRNFERHGYLLADVLPQQKIIEGGKAFTGPSVRAGARVVGLEALGRLKPVSVPTTSGASVLCYFFQHVEGGSMMRQWAAILSPWSATPLFASRLNGRDGKTWGKWYRTTSPPVVEGVASVYRGAVSPKQLAWWKRSAATFGLDETIEPDTKQFQLLPLLAELRMKV